MFIVYPLDSENIGEFYCGQTNNVHQRLLRHSSGETNSIKHGIRWKLVGYLVCETRSEAMKIDQDKKERNKKMA